MSTAKQNGFRVLKFLAQAWTIFFVTIVAYCDFAMPKLVHISDLLSCIYTGTKLFALGRLNEVYAPYNATSFAGTPCDIAAHQFLPGLPPNLVSNYNYCPLVSVLFAPFTFLPPNIFLFLWQLVSLAALVASAFFLSDGEERRQWIIWASLLFLPTAFTLWIGQFGIVFGTFFFSLGFWLLVRNRPYVSGFAFALACLKPQFVVVPGLLALVCLMRKRWQLPLSMAVSGLVLLAINVFIAGPEHFKHWLWMMKLSEIVFTNPHSGLPRHLLISIPGQLLFLFSKEQADVIKPIIYGLTICLGLVTAFACWRFSRATSQPEERSVFCYTLALGVVLMPLIVPHFMYYDLTTLMVALVFCIDPKVQTDVGIPLKKIAMALALGVNLYGVLFIWHVPIQGWALLVLLAACFISILIRKPTCSLN